MKKSIFSFLVLVSVGLTAHAASPIRVEPSETVELMSVIMYLAGNREYNDPRIWPEYRELVDSCFGGFKEHAAVKYVKELQREGYHVGYDRPMTIAANSQIKDGNFVRLGDRSAVSIIVEMAPFIRWWSEDEHEEFMSSINSFYKDTRFAEFFQKNKALYLPVQQAMEKLVNEVVDMEWVARYTGAEAEVDCIIVPSYLVCINNYGTSIERDGRILLRPVIGMPGNPGGQQEMDIKSLAELARKRNYNYAWIIMHEALHPYTNPLINKHMPELTGSGKVISPSIAKQMEQQAYGTWETVLYESLVRASVIVWMRSDPNLGEKQADKMVEHDKSQGFTWVGDMARKLEADYLPNRDKYPTLESFMPEIVKYYNDLAAEVARKLSETE